MKTLREVLIDTFNECALRDEADVIGIMLEAHETWVGMADEHDDPELWERIVEWVRGDDNEFWRSASGDHQNAIDLLYWRVEFLESGGLSRG